MKVARDQKAREEEENATKFQAALKEKADQPTAAQTQQAQPNNTLGSLVQFAMQQVLPMLA
jgi:hypothetical protein